jgi:hypothetical protein
MNKFNQGSEFPLQWELQNTDKINWKRFFLNGTIYHILVLEEVILLKCPYYPKQYAD